MYAFSNSLLGLAGEYRVEIYNMEIFGYGDVTIEIELRVFGEKGYETYIADFDVTKGDGSSANCACMNRPSKEDTFLAVEEAVISMLEDENTYWRQPSNGKVGVIFKDEDKSEE